MIEDIFWKDKTEKQAIKNFYDSLPYRIENVLSQKEQHCRYWVGSGGGKYSYVYIIYLSITQKNAGKVILWYSVQSMAYKYAPKLFL